MGASFDQLEATWTEGDKTLSIRRHGGKVNSPRLLFKGSRAIEDFKNQKIEGAKKNAGNV
jgi:hypothetical protein